MTNQTCRKSVRSHGDIQVQHVSKSIKGNVVLNDVTVCFPQGKISGIRGPNGSGKTMLLRAVAGLIKIDAGTIDVFGKRITGCDSFPDDVGFLIEPMRLWGELTAFENLRLLASIRAVIGKAEIRHTLIRVGLDPDDRRRVKAYSLGMCQRLSIAQAIMEAPSLIMLDEPTNALDLGGKLLIREILKEERARGATILVVSHDKDELDAVSDRRFVMCNGALHEG